MFTRWIAGFNQFLKVSTNLTANLISFLKDSRFEHKKGEIPCFTFLLLFFCLRYLSFFLVRVFIPFILLGVLQSFWLELEYLSVEFLDLSQDMYCL